MDIILELFDSRHVYSSGYRPQTAGITERMNQTFLDLIAKYVSKKKRTRTRSFHSSYSYRTLYNSAVKDVPFFLHYGCEPSCPMKCISSHTHQPILGRARAQCRRTAPQSCTQSRQNNHPSPARKDESASRCQLERPSHLPTWRPCHVIQATTWPRRYQSQASQAL